jgi:ubiquinone/menaquinone biosynthesis C-methylase UbiE
MLFPSFAHRRRAEEWMDAPNADPRQVEQSLRFIRRINSLLGYTRATIQHLDQMTRDLPKGARISIIDFATGSADIPRAILRWGKRRDFDIHIVGVDRHPQIVGAAARGLVNEKQVTLVQADVLALPFVDESFDFAMTAMFLHHLSDDDATCVLSEMSRVARRGMIAADLLRSRRAYVWINLMTLLADPMIRHDARVSVRQSFSKKEAVELRDRAGIDYAAYYRHFGHRFILAGQKPCGG